MKIVFVSNMLNHHQLYLCEALNKRSDSFFFVATESEYVQGYQKPSDADFVLHYDYSDQKSKAVEAIIDADVVIFGACPNELIDTRMKYNKLSFLYTERFLKKGLWRRFIPTTYRKIYDRVLRYKHKELYVLAASFYLKQELELLKFPTNKILKWGYFPELRKYENIDDILNNKDHSNGTSLLYASRLIDFKHPDYAINVAKKLRDEGYAFSLNILGDGPLYSTLQQMINQNNLSDCVHLLGSKTPGEVRNYMEVSDIFLFTSDRQEGWGAVLNEAMNSACAVVASDGPGSTAFLVEDDVNGKVYHYSRPDELFSIVKELIDDNEKLSKIQINAYNSILTEWNYEAAAERLIRLSENLLVGEKLPDLFQTGPCSRAKIIKDDWF